VAVEVLLPELGENVTGGDVLRVLVAPGETVRRDQPILELETDKATIEVPASVEGLVTEVRVAAGQKVKVGEAVLVVEPAGSARAERPGDAGRAESGAAGAAPAAKSPPAGAAPPVGAPAGASGTAGRAREKKEEAEAGSAEGPAAAELPQPAAGPVTFVLPSLGENVTGGDVLRVLVAPGETVRRDQPVLELETDKATVEVPSSIEGRVIEVRVTEGSRVNVGEVVFVAEAAAPPADVPVSLRVQRVHAAAPPVEAEDAGAETPPGPPVAEEVAPEGGLHQYVRGRLRRPEVDKPGMIEAALEEARAEAALRGAKGAVLAMPVRDEGGASRRPAPAAPSVRRVARELGVDIHQVPGTGPGGRISVEDVKAYVKKVMSAGGPRPVAPAPGVPAQPELPDFARWGRIERTPMRGVRRKTAEHLSRAWAVVPHVTQHDKADITVLEEVRRQFAPRAEAAGGKLTITAIALKVVASALRQFPQFNASVDLAREEIVYKHYVHVGVAVDTERGLLVPVIRDVDTKNIVQLAAELAQAAERARTGKLTLEDMQGGCFTITNLGGIGGTSFTPIVNHPEVAILGLSRAALEPVWRDGTFVPRLMLPLSLSYDHRVIDGADGVRFLRWVVEALEQPFVLSLLG
jgi:pyruvate dehydrogenase E2 component (dihydrolipoamide acetyltransferase)